MTSLDMYGGALYLFLCAQRLQPHVRTIWRLVRALRASKSIQEIDANLHAAFPEVQLTNHVPAVANKAAYK